ncbi:TPA: hypothetical protein DEP96_02170 [Candidatus Uhrbacteria bacterium]|nr:hypothetical protein [Candidatus Uhrbacteria bacterium]
MESALKQATEALDWALATNTEEGRQQALLQLQAAVKAAWSAGHQAGVSLCSHCGEEAVGNDGKCTNCGVQH